MAVYDLGRHPAAVDEGLDGPPALHTDGQLGPGVVVKVGRDGHRPEGKSSNGKMENWTDRTTEPSLLLH